MELAKEITDEQKAVTPFYSVLSYRQSSDYTTGWEIRGSVPGRIKIFLSSPKYPDWLWGPPNFLFNGHWHSPPQVAQQLRLKLSTHLYPMRLEMRIYTSSTPVCLHSMDKDKFTSL